MLRVQQAGANNHAGDPVVLSQPKTIDDLVAQYVYRVLGADGFAQEQMYRWEGQAKAQSPRSVMTQVILAHSIGTERLNTEGTKNTEARFILSMVL